MNASLAPLALALTVHPADVREAARRWRGRNRYGLALRPVQLIVGFVYVALGIGGLVLQHPLMLASIRAIMSIVFIVLGTVSALQGVGQLDFQPQPLTFGTLYIDDSALIVTDELGERRKFRWRAVKSVERTGDALVFVLTRRRAIVIPAAALGTYQSNLWAQLYAHLVSRRSLKATPPEDVNEIVNTALS